MNKLKIIFTVRLHHRGVTDKLSHSIVQDIEKSGIPVYKIRWWHLVVLPLGEFIRKLFIKRGYRDGVAGLLWGLHCSSATFRACALVWDEQNPVSRKDIEERLRARWKAWGEKVRGRKKL